MDPREQEQEQVIGDFGSKQGMSSISTQCTAVRKQLKPNGSQQRDRCKVVRRVPVRQRSDFGSLVFWPHWVMRVGWMHGHGHDTPMYAHKP